MYGRRVFGRFYPVALLFLLAVVVGNAFASERTGTGLKEPPNVTQLARKEIPAARIHDYQQAAKQCPGLHWTVLAAVGDKESDHGRFRGNGVQSGRNPGAGERGPAQFTDGAWRQYGKGSPYDFGDAFAATARKLCHDGAPGNNRLALRRYNGSYSYADDALVIAKRYRTGRFS